MDHARVIVEGEILEWVFTLLIDEATSLEICVHLAGLERSVGGPGLSDKLSASNVVDVHQLVLVSARAEAQFFTDDTRRVAPQHEAVEDDHDRVICAQGVQRGLVNSFGDIVACDRVEHL